MLSPIKIILLLLVVAAVFAASRIFRKGIAKGEENASKKGKKGNEADVDQTDLLKCPDCGTFVVSLEDHSCTH